MKISHLLINPYTPILTVKNLSFYKIKSAILTHALLLTSHIFKESISLADDPKKEWQQLVCKYKG